MTVKKSFGLLISLVLLASAQAEVLVWRANPGQQFGARTTRKESVIGLNTVTVKPDIVTDTTMNQEEAAKNKSTIAYLSGIPAFSAKSVDKGSVWTENANVTYNLKSFGIEKPVSIQVTVTYRLIEVKEIDSLSYYHILAEWNPLWIPDAKTSKRSGIARISGLSTMDILWDNRSGGPKKITLSDETQYRFNEKSQLVDRKEISQDFKTVTEIVRAKVVKQLTEQIATQKVENVEVKQSNEGIVLSIENIQFEAESATLAASEKTKLTRIGNLLSTLKDRKLSVVGHAANVAGSNPDELLKLSSDRAQAVADFLVQAGIRQCDMIVSSGMGGTKPIASNDTAEGRSKNRRVEIVIMDEAQPGSEALNQRSPEALNQRSSEALNQRSSEALNQRSSEEAQQ
jgi:flagellar motor protein MotB